MTIQELQSKLNHSDMEVRTKTLQSLLKMGNHEAYGLLMYVAGNHFSQKRDEKLKSKLDIAENTIFSEARESRSR